MRTTFAILLVASLSCLGARLFVTASSQFAQSEVTLGRYPLTVSCWVSLTTTNNNQAFFSLQDSSNTTSRCWIGSLGSSGFYGVIALDELDAGTRITNTGPSTTGQWTHIAGVFGSATYRTLWINGVAVGTNTASPTFIPYVERVIVGARYASGFGQYLDGSVGELAIWAEAINGDSISALSGGASPLTVRPQTLVFYAPLTSSATTTEVNLTGPALSLSNSPSRATSHPRIFAP